MPVMLHDLDFPNHIVVPPLLAQRRFVCIDRNQKSHLYFPACPTLPCKVKVERNKDKQKQKDIWIILSYCVCLFLCLTQHINFVQVLAQFPTRQILEQNSKILHQFIIVYWKSYLFVVMYKKGYPFGVDSKLKFGK